jgi:hemerythrin HHE cation binding domain-containing protein
MKPFNRRNALKVMAASTTAAGFPLFSHAADPPTHSDGKRSDYVIPSSLKAEHVELHEKLSRAMKAGGETGKAAEAVAKVLHPHFVKEEEVAMPPLGLLSDLAADRVTPEMQKFIQLSDQLKAQLPEMLREHKAIVTALDALSMASRRENQSEVERFAEMLKQHAKTEEEVLYPAAILVGEYLKLKLQK